MFGVEQMKIVKLGSIHKCLNFKLVNENICTSVVTFSLTLSQEETFWSDGFLVHPYEDTLAKLSLEVPEMFVR